MLRSENNSFLNSNFHSNVYDFNYKISSDYELDARLHE